MRLWSLHPKHLDPQGLVALWREGLLARAVLHEQTRGYRNHPQLDRFRAHPHPLHAIDAYLAVVQDDATARGYNFDRSKLGHTHAVDAIDVTHGTDLSTFAITSPFRLNPRRLPRAHGAPSAALLHRG